ncbi:hypothetical protein NW755_013631 [Fusarium falciforme]|uniref:Zn(2)-C6 fungal-type domain-containing protein n=1 Tax=Fusarium falciforme TaxID=195108 RepID=A0A9W8QSF1_9HYPO|nr:hypothetical protein NW755_013631 [Fusarium falciforme]
MPSPSSLITQSQARETGSGTLRRKRRPRAAVACDTCRTRKVKCDGGLPCSNCVKHSFRCSYKDGHSQSSRENTGPNLSVSEAVEPRNTPLTGSAGRPNLGPTSPVSLDDGPVSEAAEAAAPSADNPGSFAERSASPTAGGLGTVNQHTGGSEFYGPSGTFYFLSRLRSHAHARPQRRQFQTAAVDAGTDSSSVVNLLHSSDYTLPDTQDTSLHGPDTRSPPQPAFEPSSAARATTHNDEPLSGIEIEIQRECVRLYFDNLHCVHPILDHASFLARSKKEVWQNQGQDNSTPTPNQGQRRKQRFLALLNVVLAIGAITAGGTSSLTWDRTTKFLEEACSNHTFGNSTPSYAPIRVARLYFERAKFLLGDLLESSSIETTQTLFLMSVFCQNALKPHSCYMYSGMALRTAFAIGLPTTAHNNPSENSRLWWAMYSFEIEMCSAAGRQSFLLALSHYGIHLLSPNPAEPLLPFINCMIDFARILAEVAANASSPAQEKETLTIRSNRSTSLEKSLEDWKDGLPDHLNLGASSLRENELITKQKVVLRLRYLNMKILIHRPFLLSASVEQDPLLSDHVSSCVQAASETIRFVWDTYLYRPYFRTWWYNCTYILDATMALLYVILINTSPCPVEVILGDIDKSLEIFASMKMLAVARKCTEITREVLNAAKISHLEPFHQALEKHGEDALLRGPHGNQAGGGVGPQSFNDHLGGNGDLEGNGPTYEELYSSLVDTNLVYNFLNFEDWNAWSATDGPGAETGNFLY